MATIDECIEFALKNIGLWWRYGISRLCDEWKYIIIGRIFESQIILIPPSLTISESSSNGSYRNTDDVWWRYGISRSCDESSSSSTTCTCCACAHDHFRSWPLPDRASSGRVSGSDVTDVTSDEKAPLERILRNIGPTPIDPPQIRLELSPYTTNVNRTITG
jgi:hypothetical protein